MSVNRPRHLNYGRHRIGEDDVAAVVEVLRSDLLTQGPVVERFESALAEFVGARYAVAVSNGTAALHLASLAAGLQPGDRGVTSALTFVASANGMLYCGADAQVVDIDAEGLGMSPEALRTALAADPAIKAVVPVDFAGLAADSAALREVAGDRIVIEDAAHALGGQYACGRPVGSGAYADMTTFSFHPVKPITTGEGGAVMTNDPELARRLRLLRNHGIERDAELFVGDDGMEDGQRRLWFYEQQMLGFNYRITDLQAALGLSQLNKLPTFLNRRREAARHYDSAFAGLNHLRPHHSAPGQRDRSGLHLYTIAVDFDALGTTRHAFMHRLAQGGVGTQVHYIPVYRQPYHRQRYGYRPADYPVCEAYYQTCLSLPLHAGLTDEEVERVVSVVKGAVG